jgi:hypothetical protein
LGGIQNRTNILGKHLPTGNGPGGRRTRRPRTPTIEDDDAAECGKLIEALGVPWYLPDEIDVATEGIRPEDVVGPAPDDLKRHLGVADVDVLRLGPLHGQQCGPT